MKVAIIQEWLVTVGGSDKVVKAIADVFPNADIFTLVAKKEVCDELGIDWKKVHTSFIQKMPLGTKKHRAYLPLFPFAIEQFDLRGYDVIISSSHAVAKGVLTKADRYIFVIVILQFVMYGICITNIWKKQIWLKDSRGGL